MARDSTNCYLITSEAGEVLINAGLPAGAPRSRALFDQISRNPVRYVILTQSHLDHYGGLEAFMLPETQLIAQREYPEGRAYAKRLAPFYGRRSMKLWGPIFGGASMPPKPPREYEPNILVDDSYAFELGGRQFEILATPGGETRDSIVVWLPQERIVFTSNMFGPLYMHVPNLNTVRGDKPRSALEFIRSVRRVRDLRPETIVTGHGDPIQGAAKIQADLDKLIAAVQWIHDQTIAGMNAGKDVHTLMHEIRLPNELALGEGHGNVRWAVKAIWEEYVGWFYFDSTTSLYDVPPSSIYADLTELAGGAKQLAARARDHLTAGRPLQALHLTDIALSAEPKNSEAQSVKRDALQTLLDAGQGSNLSETMWLRAELAALQGN
jgi:alkyl sulfatase BDS1-like metallo-beta-lactamase superfamily hydrolase